MNLPPALVPLSRNAQTGLVWAHLLTGVTGTGTSSDPFMGWASRLPYAANACICFGPYYYGISTESEFTFHTDGYSGMKLLGYGTTILYTGSSNISTMGYFSGNEANLGNEGMEIRGFTFDGNSKVTGDMVFIQSLHSGIFDFACKRGTGTAVKVKGCSGPTFNRLRCTWFDHAGLVNPFATGLAIDEVGSTSNDTTVGAFRGLEINGTQSDGITVDNSLSIVLEGGSGASVNGWGVVAGLNGPVESLELHNFDLEANGPLLAASGGHQGLRVASGCQQTLFSNCENLDASIQIDSGAGTVTALNSHFYGAIHNSATPFIQIGCLGMDPSSNQMYGTGTGLRLFLNHSTIGRFMLPDCSIGQGTNGTLFDYSGFGFPVLLNATDKAAQASTGAYYGLGMPGGASGVTLLNGAAGLDLRASNTTALSVRVTGGAPKLGFYGTGAIVKQTVTGSRGANAALASALTTLANLGLITDNTTI